MTQIKLHVNEVDFSFPENNQHHYWKSLLAFYSQKSSVQPTQHWALLPQYWWPHADASILDPSQPYIYEVVRFFMPCVA